MAYDEKNNEEQSDESIAFGMAKRRKSSSPREEKKCRLRYDAMFFLNADQLTFSAVEMIPKGMLWMEKSESGLVSMKDMLRNVFVVGEGVVEWSGEGLWG